jgi:acyl-CoA reductase-like NAD-dependent aldehyde dehydrogenase
MSEARARAALKDSVYINGTWVKPEGTFSVVSGITGEAFAQCPLATVKDVDAACTGAAAAFKTWRKTPAAERADWLRKLADELEKRKDDVAS